MISSESYRGVKQPEIWVRAL